MNEPAPIPSLDVRVHHRRRGCPVLALFARAGSDAADTTFVLLHKPRCLCGRGSRPLQTAQRTGHPPSCLCQRIQKPGPPALQLLPLLQGPGGPSFLLMFVRIIYAEGAPSLRFLLGRVAMLPTQRLSFRTNPLPMRSWFPPFADCAKDGAPS